MFCKWCGATLQQNARICQRCGREQPAKSDCGGFYDLVSPAAAPKPTAAVPTVQPVRNTKQNSSVALVIPVVLAAVVLLVAMLISSVLILGRIASAESTLESVSQELGEANKRIRDLEKYHTEPTEPEVTEPATTSPQTEAPAVQDQTDSAVDAPNH